MTKKAPFNIKNTNVRKSSDGDVSMAKTSVVPYDENLFERTRTQWQFGDWQSLCKLSLEVLQNHPDRAKIALIAAAGHLQMGNSGEARRCFKMAQDWGVNTNLAKRILIAGVHNSLGRAYLLQEERQKSFHHFESALSIGSPGNDISLLTTARLNMQNVDLNRGPHKFLRKNFHSVYTNQNKLGSLNYFNFKKSEIPKLIIVNGMVRSGSTVSMNIVTDLLSVHCVPFVKYFIRDFETFLSLRDHIIQNPDLSFVVKTHAIDEEMIRFSKTWSSRYVYTKRNLLEVAASYVRMSRVPKSAFWKNRPVTLDELFKILDTQLVEYEKAKRVKSLVMLDCEDFSDSCIASAVSSIGKHLNLSVCESDVDKIAKLRSRKGSFDYVKTLGEQSMTSLGHDRYSFFHLEHVLNLGTSVKEYISSEWIKEIIDKYSSVIDSYGNIK